MAYIYEHIRTQGYDPLHFEEHFSHLEATAIAHFNEPLKISREELRKAIKECLQSERFSPAVMNAVEVKYYPDGVLRIEAKELLYNTFSLRALHPQSYLCQVSGDALLDNTSAKSALIEFQHATSPTDIGSVAIWASESGEVLAIDGAAVVAVFDNEVRFSNIGDGVEFNLAFESAAKLKRNIVKAPICVEELENAKEVIFINYEGVSALHSYKSTLYMHLIAEKIAESIAEREHQ